MANESRSKKDQPEEKPRSEEQEVPSGVNPEADSRSGSVPTEKQQPERGASSKEADSQRGAESQDTDTAEPTESAKSDGAGGGEVARLREQVAEYEEQASQLQQQVRELEHVRRELAVAQAALRHGLTVEDMDLISGLGSPEEIEAKAEQFAKRLRAAGAAPDPRLGQEQVSQGSGDWLRDQFIAR